MDEQENAEPTWAAVWSEAANLYENIAAWVEQGLRPDQAERLLAIMQRFNDMLKEPNDGNESSSVEELESTLGEGFAEAPGQADPTAAAAIARVARALRRIRAARMRQVE